MSLAASPFVSVVIPTHNRAAFVGAAVESALSQTLAPVEVIVIDDGSTDGTAAVISAFEGSVRTVRQPNLGPSAARNVGVRTSTAPLVQFLDSDDMLQPTALEEAWTVASASPETAVFVGGWDEVDVDGRLLARVDAPSLPTDLFHGLFNPLLIGPASRFLVRRSALDLVGPFDTELQGCEDWDMWLRLAAAGVGFKNVRGRGVQYRNHSGSLSKTENTMWRGGRTVLNRAAGYHVNCSACRGSRRRGLAVYREWCLRTVLVPRLRRQWTRRHYDAVLREISHACSQDPALAAVMVRYALRSVLLDGPHAR